MKREVKIGDLIFTSEIPCICVPLMATNFEELKVQLEEIVDTNCDVVEWRVDCFKEDISKALVFLNEEKKEKKLLFTYRTKEEGGEGEKGLYFDILKIIENNEPDMVDIELWAAKEMDFVSKFKNSVCVMSKHFFENTPEKETVRSIYEEMEKLGADIPKIAVMPNDFKDVCSFSEVTNEVSAENSPIIGISMGEIGCLTRIACRQMGSCMTFASVGKTSAPGQLPCELVRSFLDL